MVVFMTLQQICLLLKKGGSVMTNPVAFLVIFSIVAFVVTVGHRHDGRQRQPKRS